MRGLLLFLAVMAAASRVYSDEAPDATDFKPIGTVATLCDAQTGTGDCTAPSGDEIVMDVGAYRSVTFVSTGSTGTYSCDIVGNNVGHDAATGSGQTLNSTSLSGSQLAITLTDTPRFIWATCTANSGTVTITAFGRQDR